MPVSGRVEYMPLHPERWDACEDKDGTTVALHDTQRLIDIESVAKDFPVPSNRAFEDIAHSRDTVVALLSAFAVTP